MRKLGSYQVATIVCKACCKSFVSCAPICLALYHTILSRALMKHAAQSVFETR